jgi:hypothetical protein
VITGKTTTRKRSTRPALRSDRHRVRLPSVVIGLVPSCFIASTALTASPVTSRVLAQDNGSFSVEENTTLDALESSAIESSSSVVSPDSDGAVSANPDINRYVFAPIKISRSGCWSSQARYSGPLEPPPPGPAFCCPVAVQ